MSASDDPQTLAQRLTHLELMFMHLERQVAELNEVVLQQQRQLDALQRRQRTIHAEHAPDESLPATDADI